MNRKQVEAIKDNFVEIIKSVGNECRFCGLKITDGSIALADQESVWHPLCYKRNKSGEQMQGLEQKSETIEEWTEQDEAVYAPLRRKKLRIDAKSRRDKSRVRRFSHKIRKQ